RKSYLPHELLSVERRDNPRVAGAGDLIFEYVFIVGEQMMNFPATDGQVRRTDMPQRSPRGFFFLDDVRAVGHLIRTTLLGNLEQELDEPAAAPLPSGAPADRGSARAENYREDGSVPAGLREKVLADLGANERPVWVGQPATALVLRRSLGHLV